MPKKIIRKKVPAGQKKRAYEKIVGKGLGFVGAETKVIFEKNNTPWVKTVPKPGYVLNDSLKKRNALRRKRALNKK